MAMEKSGKGALLAKGREALLQYNLVLRLVPDFLPVGGSVSEHTLGDGAQAGFSCIVRGLGSSQD